MRARGLAPGLSLLLAAWAGCGSSLPADPTVIPLGSWGREVAAVECAQIFGCCDATERMKWGYADETQCRQMIAAKQQMDLSQIVSMGLVTYDGKAARSCLDEATAAGCTQIQANAIVGVIGPSCPKVTHGAGKQGSPCEDLDFICESSNCDPGSGTCAPPRPCWQVTCDPGLYCDASLPGCTPVKTDGTPCGGNAECTSPSVCIAGVCGAPLQDGAACSSDSDCAIGSCVHTGPTATACGPRLPDGSPCVLTTDCASGGCASTATGGAVCGRRFCSGV